MHLADLIDKWLFGALQKTPKFIGQCYRQVYALQLKIKFWLNLSYPSYSWIIRARSLRKNDNQPRLKDFTKKKLEDFWPVTHAFGRSHWQVTIWCTAKNSKIYWTVTNIVCDWIPTAFWSWCWWKGHVVCGVPHSGQNHTKSSINC